MQGQNKKRIEEIAHYGFHFGFQSEWEGGLSEYPRECEWELVQDHFGVLDVDEKFAFVQAFLEGIKAEECDECGNGVVGHRHFMAVIYR